MDVDAINLSPEERSKRLKQGACFTCGELGHRAKDHFDPNFKAKGTTTNRPYIARTGNQTEITDLDLDRPDPPTSLNRSEDSPRSTRLNSIGKPLELTMKKMKIFLFPSRRCLDVTPYSISDPPSIFCRTEPKNYLYQDQYPEPKRIIKRRRDSLSRYRSLRTFYWRTIRKLYEPEETNTRRTPRSLQCRRNAEPKRNDYTLH